jgi:hypothetical protein
VPEEEKGDEMVIARENVSQRMLNPAEAVIGN